MSRRLASNGPAAPFSICRRVKAEPKQPTDEKAPEPVTPEDTVIAADIEADLLEPDETGDETPPAR